MNKIVEPGEYVWTTVEGARYRAWRDGDGNIQVDDLNIAIGKGDEDIEVDPRIASVLEALVAEVLRLGKGGRPTRQDPSDRRDGLVDGLDDGLGI